MKKFLKFFAAPIVAAVLSGVIVAWAAQTNYLGTVFIADSTVPARQLTVNADGSINVTASVTATVTGFAPGGAFASLTATGSSADVALPAGTVVAFQNTGTTTVSCTLTVGAGTAVAGENQIPASSTVYFTVGSNTHGSCIDESGSASNVVRLSGGTGLGTGFGGGGGSGGGAVTIADGASVNLGSLNDAAWSSGNGTITAILKAISNAANSAIVAGTNLIGKIGIDQTTPGTTNAVAIDQTTPGTTNKVVASVASGGIASGAIASGAVASGAFASGAIGSGAIASGAVASGAIASGAVASGAISSGAIASGAFAAGSFANATAADPCMFAAKTNVAIAATGTTTVKLVSLASSQKIYVCSLSLITAGATIFSIYDGTKSSVECDTAGEAVIGAAAAAGAGGLSLAANGGMTFGNGGSTVALTNTVSHDLCISQSGAGVIAGNITYVQRVP